MTIRSILPALISSTSVLNSDSANGLEDQDGPESKHYDSGMPMVPWSAELDSSESERFDSPAASPAFSDFLPDTESETFVPSQEEYVDVSPSYKEIENEVSRMIAQNAAFRASEGLQDDSVGPGTETLAEEILDGLNEDMLPDGTVCENCVGTNAQDENQVEMSPQIVRVLAPEEAEKTCAAFLMQCVDELAGHQGAISLEGVLLAFGSALLDSVYNPKGFTPATADGISERIHAHVLRMIEEKAMVAPSDDVDLSNAFKEVQEEPAIGINAAWRKVN